MLELLEKTSSITTRFFRSQISNYGVSLLFWKDMKTNQVNSYLRFLCLLGHEHVLSTTIST